MPSPRQLVVALVAAGAGSVVAVVQAMQLWRASLGVPFSYSGDALAMSMNVKQVTERGWDWNDPRLAAPFVQHFQDWPLPEVLHLLGAKVLAVFSSNWAAVLNGVYLLSFPLAAVSACYVFIRLGISRFVAVALGIVFSVLPYHVMRGEDHLFLAIYFAVPLGCWLALCVFNGETLFARRAPGRTSLMVACCLLVAMSGAYYAAFTIAFVVIAAVVRALHARTTSGVGAAAVACLLIVGMGVVDSLPTLWYRHQHGTNLVVGKRQPVESDVYGFRLADALMPTPGHRIGALDRFQERYVQEFPQASEREASTLGLLPSVGLLYLLGLALSRAFAARKERAGAAAFGGLAVLSVVSILLATSGGLSTFVGLLVSPQLRSWNRISVFVAFLSLAAMGLLVDAAVRRYGADGDDVPEGRGGRRRRLAPVLAGTLVVIGVLDQTNARWTPAYAAVGGSYLADAAYFRAIEDRLPPSASVFQLPRMVFPESPSVGSIGSYGLLKPYLHTTETRWSFGGIHGRLQSAWQERLAPPTSPDFLFDIVAARFDGLYVDRDGYTGNPAEAAAIEAVATAAAGAPAVSADGRKAFYDIREHADRLRATMAAELERRRQELLFPAFVEWSDEFYAPEVEGAGRRWWADGDDAVVHLYNAGEDRMRARVTFTLATATGRPSDFRITWPDGFLQVLRTSAEPVRVEREVALRDGRSSVRIVSDAERVAPERDPRRLHFQVVDPAASPA